MTPKTYYSESDQCWYVPVAEGFPRDEVIEPVRIQFKDDQLWITKLDSKFPDGIEKLVAKLQDQLVPNHDRTPNWFDWQSLPLSSFYIGMRMIRNKLGEGRHKFLDVGSGIGTKLFLADSLGFDAYGIEHNYEYRKVSLRLWPNYIVWLNDALDFTDYDQFDVVYSYRLARNNELQECVNNHILEHMREGAIFFSNDTVESQDKMMESRGVVDFSNDGV